MGSLVDVARTHLASLKRALNANLTPLQEARLFARTLKDQVGVSQRELAAAIGVSQTRISQRLALLEMPGPILELLDSPGGELTERHARALRHLPDRGAQVQLARRIVKHRLTVAETEELVAEQLAALGIHLKSLWSRAPGLRWRRREGWLELHVGGASHAQQLRTLKRFLAIFRRDPRDS